MSLEDQSIRSKSALAAHDPFDLVEFQPQALIWLEPCCGSDVDMLHSSFGLIAMRWTVFNALGCLAWLAGLVYAKGADGPAASYLSPDGHNVLIGALMGAAGLALLLWANFRTAV